MSEKPRIAASIEKEPVKNKLDKLNPQELIPAEFANIEEITGSVKVLLNKTHGHIDYAIADDGKTSLHKMENDFEFHIETALKESLKSKQNKNQYARPLVHGSLIELSPAILYAGIVETNPVLRGKGAGVAFQEQLANVAKNLGFKFLAGYQNDAKTARFFLKRGRYLLEEVKDEKQSEFQPVRDLEGDETVFYTVKFLNPEDITEYIMPERIDTTIEDKLEFKEKILTLHDIFYNVTEILKKVQAGKEKDGDRATIIEILEDLNQILPQNDRYPLPELHEDNENIAPILREAFEHLKKKLDVLAREATMEQLTSNIV